MLSSMRKNLRRNEEGFSLVEILVVIVILGILAAVAMGLYNDSKRLAIRAGVYQDIKHAEIEISTWLAQNKPVLGAEGGEGQIISVVKTGNNPPVDLTGAQYLPVADKLNIPVSDSRTSLRITVDNIQNIPSAGPYDINILVQNGPVGGTIIYHPTQGGRTTGVGLLYEGWK